MAAFKEGDWVKITPTADKKWQRWANNAHYYNNFLDQIGVIEEIDEDPSCPDTLIYKIKVYFVENVYDGYEYLGPGNYCEYFKDRHLIKSSKYEADLKISRYKAGNELQEWENFKKKTTDDMLRKVFAPDPPAKKEEVEEIIKKYEEEDPYDPYDPWINPKDYNSDYD